MGHTAGVALDPQLSTFNRPCAGHGVHLRGRLNDGANPANGSYDLTFAIFNAVSGAGQAGNNFARSQKFSLEKRSQDSFGVHSGEGEYEVVIRLNARVADYVREKKWHESQQLRELKGGGGGVADEAVESGRNRALDSGLGR